MANIIKFPKEKGSAPQQIEVKPARVREAQAQHDAPSAAWGWLWMIVRVPLFLVLYWLRAPVMFLCEIIWLPSLLIWIFLLFVWPEKNAVVVWGFAVISFSTCVLMWLYDSLLMALSPQDIVRTL